MDKDQKDGVISVDDIKDLIESSMYHHGDRTLSETAHRTGISRVKLTKLRSGRVKHRDFHQLGWEVEQLGGTLTTTIEDHNPKNSRRRR